MSEKQKSYRQILKATSIFGGVQVINILISIIRSKFLAVLLGPTGMGINGLLNSTIGIIFKLTSFGLGTSAVKNISEAYTTGDNQRISKTVITLRRLIWITGALGAVVTLICSKWLSLIAFGNTNYTIAFVWISITLLFNQLSSGQLVILQGMRKLKHLANANLTGALIGLIVSLPFYYFWKIDGIVPAIVVTSAILLLRAWFFVRKIKIEPVQINFQQTRELGKGMIKMGSMLNLSSLINIGVGYLLRVYISQRGGVAEVGLYTAGFAIINGYVNMIFSAMATDYYPRLASVSADNHKVREQINYQAEFSILILSPILIIFFVLIRYIIVLLYSNKFDGINNMILWAALGIYFKAVSWSIGFVFVAKGEAKKLITNELLTNSYIFLFNILGYIWRGLEGLGISFLVGYSLHLLQMFYVSKKYFEFRFEKSFLKVYIIQLLLGIFCFIQTKIFSSPWTYIYGSIFFIVSLIYSLTILNRRLDLRTLLNNFKFGKKRNQND